MPVTVKSVCPLNCPDTCGIVTEVEDGRVVRTAGDPDHPITRGWLCRKGEPLPGAPHQPGPAALPAAAGRAEGRGALRADLLGRGAGHDRRALAGDHRRVGPGGDPAVRLLRHDGRGAADGRRAPLPEPAGRQHPRPQHLLGGRARRDEGDPRRLVRRRSGGHPEQPPDPALGLQPGRHQPARRAAAPGGEAERRDDRGDRSARHRDRALRRLAPPAVPRHGRRPGAGRSRTCCSRTGWRTERSWRRRTVGWEALRERAADYTPERVAADHPPAGRGDPPAGPAVRRAPARPRSRPAPASSATPTAARRCAACWRCRPSPASTADLAAGFLYNNRYLAWDPELLGHDAGAPAAAPRAPSASIRSARRCSRRTRRSSRCWWSTATRPPSPRARRS